MLVGAQHHRTQFWN